MYDSTDKNFQKNQNLLIYICVFMYLMMMASKSIFTAEIVEIIDVFQTTASKASLANLYYYATYAIMQVALIFFIDKINIKVYLGVTVICSALISICIGIVGHLGAEIGFIFVLFTLNGFLQAGIYGCSIKLFNKYLTKENYYKGLKLVNGAQIIATVISYGLSSLFVALGRWELPFIIIGASFLLSSVLFVVNVGKAIKNINKYKTASEDTNKQEKNTTTEKVKCSKITARYLYVYILVMCIIALLGNSAHYGINNWFSKLLYDVYNFPKAYSILVSVGINLVLTAVSILSIELCSKAKNYYMFSIAGFVGAICFAIPLAFLYNSGIIVAVILCLLFLLFNRWAKVPYSSITAYKLRECLEPGKYSLILNAVASVAAGVAPTILSLMFESFGWGWSFISVAIMGAVLVCLVLLAVLIDKKLFKNIEKDKNTGE